MSCKALPDCHSLGEGRAGAAWAAGGAAGGGAANAAAIGAALHADALAAARREADLERLQRQGAPCMWRIPQAYPP
jgi:hypothetical protein